MTNFTIIIHEAVDLNCALQEILCTCVFVDAIFDFLFICPITSSFDITSFIKWALQTPLHPLIFHWKTPPPTFCIWCWRNLVYNYDHRANTLRIVFRLEIRRGLIRDYVLIGFFLYKSKRLVLFNDI